MHSLIRYPCAMIKHENKSLISGTLNSIILALLKENESMYGYEICCQVNEKTKNNIQLKEGAIYPALHKLEKKGLITSEKKEVNGRVRKYYAIVKSKQKIAEEQIKQTYQFAQLIQGLIKPAL